MFHLLNCINMGDWVKAFGIAVVFFSLLVGVSYVSGWIRVHQTGTIEKSQQDAEREVFEESQSYVEGKRQEALKFYQEYNYSGKNEKLAIKKMVAHSFANFDENKLDLVLANFVRDCKYN